TVFERP
ncbi:acetyl-CoA C-acyltransferase FadA, partial [Vibrio parahaemolyticus VP2007-007]